MEDKEDCVNTYLSPFQLWPWGSHVDIVSRYPALTQRNEDRLMGGLRGFTGRMKAESAQRFSVVPSEWRSGGRRGTCKLRELQG